MKVEDIYDAITDLKNKEKTYKNIEAKTGVAASSIINFMNRKRNIEGMQLKTFVKLFPNMKIDFDCSDTELERDIENKEIIEWFETPANRLERRELLTKMEREKNINTENTTAEAS